MDERLIERCNGELEGKLESECVNIVDFIDENDSKLGIETSLKFRGRIENFLSEVLSEVEKNYSNKKGKVTCKILN